GDARRRERTEGNHGSASRTSGGATGAGSSTRRGPGSRFARRGRVGHLRRAKVRHRGTRGGVDQAQDGGGHGGSGGEPPPAGARVRRRVAITGLGAVTPIG